MRRGKIPAYARALKKKQETEKGIARFLLLLSKYTSRCNLEFGRWERDASRILMSMIRAYLHPNLASSELKQGQKEIVNFSLEIYSNTTWEVGE